MNYKGSARRYEYQTCIKYIIQTKIYFEFRDGAEIFGKTNLSKIYTFTTMGTYEDNGFRLSGYRGQFFPDFCWE